MSRIRLELLVAHGDAFLIREHKRARAPPQILQLVRERGLVRLG